MTPTGIMRDLGGLNHWFFRVGSELLVTCNLQFSGQPDCDTRDICVFSRTTTD
jgi:hypothetical protein